TFAGNALCYALCNELAPAERCKHAVAAPDEKAAAAITKYVSPCVGVRKVQRVGERDFRDAVRGVPGMPNPYSSEVFVLQIPYALANGGAVDARLTVRVELRDAVGVRSSHADFGDIPRIPA